MAAKKAAQRLAGEMKLSIKALSIGDGEVEDPDGQWAGTHGVGDSGAVLVRPDGYVAWRGRSITTDPAMTLRAALTRILSIPSLGTT